MNAACPAAARSAPSSCRAASQVGPGGAVGGQADRGVRPAPADRPRPPPGTPASGWPGPSRPGPPAPRAPGATPARLSTSAAAASATMRTAAGSPSSYALITSGARPASATVGCAVTARHQLGGAAAAAQREALADAGGEGALGGGGGTNGGCRVRGGWGVGVGGGWGEPVAEVLARRGESGLVLRPEVVLERSPEAGCCRAGQGCSPRASGGHRGAGPAVGPAPLWRVRPSAGGRRRRRSRRGRPGVRSRSRSPRRPGASRSRRGSGPGGGRACGRRRRRCRRPAGCRRGAGVPAAKETVTSETIRTGQDRPASAQACSSTRGAFGSAIRVLTPARPTTHAWTSLPSTSPSAAFRAATMFAIAAPAPSTVGLPPPARPVPSVRPSTVASTARECEPPTSSPTTHGSAMDAATSRSPAAHRVCPLWRCVGSCQSELHNSTPSQILDARPGIWHRADRLRRMPGGSLDHRTRGDAPDGAKRGVWVDVDSCRRRPRTEQMTAGAGRWNGWSDGVGAVAGARWGGVSAHGEGFSASAGFWAPLT